MRAKFKEAAKELKSKLDDMDKHKSEKEHIHIHEEEDSFTAKIAEKFSGPKKALNEFKVIDKIKHFSSDAVKMVAELDEHLMETNSPYEVGDFKVGANIGVAAGMSLDIRFKKMQAGETAPQKTQPSLSILNPKTGKAFNVAKNLLTGKKRAKVRDPETGEILVIDVKTGQVLSLEKK